MIDWRKSIPSTHQYVSDLLRSNSIVPPYALGCDEQPNGIGSRGNGWIGKRGNLFFSFCVEEKHLPEDLPLASISIYFSALLKHVLEAKGSKVWLKWPNDFYLDEQKIGGIITTKINTSIIGSIGLNLLHSPEEFGVLDIKIKPKELALLFLKVLEEKRVWKKVFSKYQLEFDKNGPYAFHLDGKVVSLRDAILNNDGSITIENKKVYSLR